MFRWLGLVPTHLPELGPCMVDHIVPNNESYFDQCSKEATGSPKRKSPLKKEGSQGCRRRTLRPHTSRQHQRKKRNKMSTLGTAPQKSNCCAGQSREVRGSSVSRLNAGSRLLLNRGCSDLRPGEFRSCPRVGKPLWEEVLWPFLDAWDSAATHSVHAVEHPREVWAAWRAFLLFDSSQNLCQTVRLSTLLLEGGFESQS